MECFLLIVVTFLSGETEAVIQSCFQEKLFWKYAANLKENAHVKVQSNFIEIALRHGCSPVNLLHIFGTPFPRNTSEWLSLALEGFLGTLALKALGHSVTWAIGHWRGTWELRHVGTRVTLFS